jgi:hypothetical protein
MTENCRWGGVGAAKDVVCCCFLGDDSIGLAMAM